MFCLARVLGFGCPWRPRGGVFGVEVGSRWSNEASNFIRMLAKARVRSSPSSLQAATSAALVSRRSALLSENLPPHCNHEGNFPPLGHLLSHMSPPVPVSRLTARQRKVWIYTFPTTSTFGDWLL